MGINRIARLISGGLLALFCIIIPTASAHAQTDLRSIATQIVGEMTKDPQLAVLKGKKLLIAEFDNLGGQPDSTPHMFEGMLTTAMVKSKCFKVVERALLEKCLKKNGLSMRTLSDPENAKKVGKLLGAPYLVVGDISAIGSSICVDARVVSIETFDCIAACFAGNALVPGQPSASSSDTNGADKPTAPYTSLIINASEFTLKRVMAPKIRLADGTEVWGFVEVDLDWISENGMVSYATSLDQAMTDKRAGNNPLVINATGVYDSPSKSDPVVDEADAKIIEEANKISKFLTKYKVVFVSK
ncbi:MAG: CsgG/HfaB family protein [Armatimonadota bacterium]